MLGCCLGDVDKGTPNPCYRLLSQITQRTHTNAELVAAYGAGDGGEDVGGLLVGTAVCR